MLEDQILPNNSSKDQETISTTEKIETLIVIENTDETPLPPAPEVVVPISKKPEPEITTEELIEILKEDESKENQPCKEVSEDQHHTVL